MTADERREHIRRIVDRAPALTPERAAELRALLAPAVSAVRVVERAA